MTAPEAQAENEEGGMLVAALAGVGILLAVGLMIFSGGDDADPAAEGDASAQVAEAKDGKKAGGAPSAFEAREVDDATRANPTAVAQDGAPKGRLNPAVEGMLINQGQLGPGDPSDAKPPAFDTPDEERAWWERQLADAERLKTMRQRAIDKLPEIEKSLDGATDPDVAREQFEARKERLYEAMRNSEARIAEIEAKLVELR